MAGDPAQGTRFDAKAHWESVYRTRRVDEVSWFQREPTVSLALIRRFAPDTAARIIDIGGGASSLVDTLVTGGYSAITVLDLSSAALAHARERIGPRAAQVTWLESNVLTASLPPAAFDVWHDRALFHFLIAAADRAAYVAQLRASLRPQGLVIIATFAEDGPTRCSGLPVVRYSAGTLHSELGPSFRLLERVNERHTTPAGVVQSFVYCAFQFAPND
jgi:2-polyprenyl-3-methyl-5-hydroxy-6-metoxy-1,4-benzoquinol methylase